jgi:hypothetical protein
VDIPVLLIDSQWISLHRHSDDDLDLADDPGERKVTNGQP